MFDVHTPGAHFILGHLCLLRRSGEAKAIGAWPDLKAIRRSRTRASWEPFAPRLRLISRDGSSHLRARPLALPFAELTPPGERSVLDPSRSTTARHLAERRRCAFGRYRSTFPDEVARATERYPSRHWRVLRLFRSRPQAVELAEQNPALAFCLASHGRFRERCPHDAVVEMSRRRQRDIMGWLGFPDAQGAARMLSRIVPEAVHLRSMRRLQRALMDPAVGQILAHTPVIHAGVLGLVSEPRILHAVTPALVAEVADRRDELCRPATARMLVDLDAMVRQFPAIARPATFRTIARLREVHDEVALQYSARRDLCRTSRRFPRPPIPGNSEIVPIRTARGLVNEGAAQGHCVANYIDRVLRGTVYVYRVHYPERATLSIVPAPDGGWEIEDLLLSYNREPDSETWEHVESWLDEHQPAGEDDW